MSRKQLILGFLLLVACLLYIWQHGIYEFPMSFEPPVGQGSDRSAKIYQLSNPDWIEFPISSELDSLKIVSNASMRREWLENIAATGITERINYSIEYRLLDRTGVLLDSGTYYFRTGLAEPEELAAGNWPLYFRSVADIPLLGQSAILQTQEIDAIALALRRSDLPKQLENIFVRVYTRQKIDDTRLATQWLRLSDREKEYAANAAIYHHELMSEGEKKALIMNRWRPVGPGGVEGVDFTVGRLYAREQDVDDDPRDLIVPDGNIVTPFRNVTYRLTDEDGEKYSLSLASLDPMDATFTASVYVTQIVDHGGEVSRIANYYPDVTAGVNFGTLSAGEFIDISCQCTALVHLHRDDNPDAIEYDPWFTRVYTAQSSRDIRYRVSHLPRQKSIIRLDLRSSIIAPLGNTAVVTLRDVFNQILSTHTFDLPAEASRYDVWYAQFPLSGALPDAYTRYFSLPQNVEYLDVSGGLAPVFVSAATRPTDLIETLKTAGTSNRNSDEYLPRWFLFNSPEHDQYRQEKRTELILSQPRPPASQIAAGEAEVEYLWEAFEPTGSWIAQNFYANAAVRDGLTPSQQNVYFKAMNTLAKHSLSWSVPFGAKTVRPRLLFVNLRGRASELTWQLDDLPPVRMQSSNALTDIVLPEVDSGVHTLRVSHESNTKLFTNRQQFIGDALKKHRAWQLKSGESRSFVFEKYAPLDVVNIHGYFPEAANGGSFTLTIDKRGGANSSAYERVTPPGRRYVLDYTKAETVYRYPRDNNLIYRKQIMFFPLGDDLSAGRVSFVVKNETAADIFLTFSHLVSGQVVRRDLFVEDAP